MIHLYQADCAIVLPVITSVSAVIIDPPFGTKTRVWDIEPPAPVWSELRRLCPDGPIAVCGYAKQLFRWAKYFDGLQLIGYVVWHTYNTTLASPGLTRVHQDIMIWGKSLKQIRADKVREPYSEDDSLCSLYNVWHTTPTQNIKGQTTQRLATGRATRHPDGRRCSDLWAIPAPGAGFNSHQRLHPNQKPTELMHRLVLLLTDKGQTVLDCYMGSGTTGKVCIATDRHFIGVESDPEHFETAQRRLEQVEQERRGEWHIKTKRSKPSKVNEAQLSLI